MPSLETKRTFRIGCICKKCVSEFRQTIGGTKAFSAGNNLGSKRLFSKEQGNFSNASVSQVAPSLHLRRMCSFHVLRKRKTKKKKNTIVNGAVFHKWPRVSSDPCADISCRCSTGCSSCDSYKYSLHFFAGRGPCLKGLQADALRVRRRRCSAPCLRSSFCFLPPAGSRFVSLARADARLKLQRRGGQFDQNETHFLIHTREKKNCSKKGLSVV